MRKSRDKDFITNAINISSISHYKIITFRTKKQISISFNQLELFEDMNQLIICKNLKLLCIIPIQKLLVYHFKGVCLKLLEDQQKCLLRIISYDI